MARFFELDAIDRILRDGALSLLWLLAVSCSPRDLLLPISKLLLSASLYYRTLLDHQYEWSWFQRRKDHLEVPGSRFQIEVPGSLTGLVRPPTYVWPVLPLTVLSPSAAKAFRLARYASKELTKCRTLCGFERAQIVRDRKRKMVNSEIADFAMPTNPKFQDCRHRRDFRLDSRKGSRAEQVRVVQGND